MEALLAALQAGGGGAVAAIAAAVVVLAALYFAWMGSKERANTPPVVPGLPLIGNLLQLDEKMPHKTFAKWSEIYGPIYTIRTGASSVVVLNSTEVAKEAMVAKFTSISTRKLAKAFSVLSRDKTMIATSDYGEFHTKAKRFIREGLLGSSAQRRFRDTRQKMMDNMLNTFHSLVIGDPHGPQNFREVFRDEIFRVTLIESLGEDVSSVYVKEFGREISKEEMHRTMVVDMMTCVIVADWRDYFPYLSWIPNKSFDTRLVTAESRRTASRVSYSYLDFLLADGTLTDSVDDAGVGGHLRAYRYYFGDDRVGYDRLYQEIQEVCGEDTVVTEDHLSRLPYLNAVFHETLRLHPPISVLPRRFVHQTTTLGGYKIPAGTEVTINVYGCNMNKEEWEEPEEWRPERFLDGRFDSADMFKTLSFGAGKRVCAGSAQAISISCAAIARFVQEFAWRLKGGDEDEANAVQFVGHKLHPLYVYLSPRGGT
ncbi:hypothetical protein ACQ4PT_067443 [Festuca glaucescens]